MTNNIINATSFTAVEALSGDSHTKAGANSIGRELADRFENDRSEMGGVPEVCPDAVEQFRPAGSHVLGEELKLRRSIAVVILVPNEGELHLARCSLHRYLPYIECQ